MQQDIHGTATVPPPIGGYDAPQYRWVFRFLAFWAGAVVLMVSAIDGEPPAPVWETQPDVARGGYTFSLILVLLPLAYVVLWYFRNRTALNLQPIMKTARTHILVAAGVWTLLDVLLAHKLFTFPNPNATILPKFWAYSWSGACSTAWTIASPACYARGLPVEELIFYLGAAALLTMLYMWGAEDFFAAYGLPRRQYEEAAKAAPPLVNWSLPIIAGAVVLVGAAIAVKKLATFHPYHEGLPIYFIAQVLMVALPVSALYRNVKRFTNTRAFLLVLLLQVLMSVIWEATLALPYGWWNYNMESMMGITVTPWSGLAVEACVLWLSVAWSVMFIYEARKIKALTGRTWRKVLFG